MNNQEITDNAPDGATHYDCCEYMRHVHNGNWEYWSKESGWEETVPEDDTRSLADIKRIVELAKIALELVSIIENYHDSAYCDVFDYDELQAAKQALQEPKP